MNKIIIASGPVIVEKGKALLDKSGDDSFWKFCGGKADIEAEDLQETAIRRAKEELGVDIEIIDPEPFLMHIKSKTDDGEIDVILVNYNAKRINEEITPGEDIKEWKWVPLADLDKEELGLNIEPALVHFWYLDK